MSRGNITNISEDRYGYVCQNVVGIVLKNKPFYSMCWNGIIHVDLCMTLSVLLLWMLFGHK